MRMDKYITITLLSILVLVPVMSWSQVEITGITITGSYDLYVNSGVMILNATLSSGNPAIIDIPLIGENIYVINVTDEDGNVLPFSYSEANKIVSVYVNETAIVSVTYTVSNVFDEISIGAYSGILDLSVYRAPVNVILTFIGKYNVSVEPEAKISYTEDTTIVEIDTPTVYTIVLWYTPIPPTPATTATPTQTGPIQTSPTPTPSPSPTTTPTPTPTPSPTTPAPGIAPELIYTIVGIIVIIVILVLLKKR
ncbi:MAG: hypothetical protein ABWW65_07850 [Thermoprotei archaeon]